MLDRPVKLDVWASYLPGPNALSKTPRQHVNASYCEHTRNRNCWVSVSFESCLEKLSILWRCVTWSRCVCVCVCNKP